MPNVLAAEGAGEALHLEGMSSEQVAAVLLVLGLPLAGFLLTALVGRRMGERPWIISVTAILAATAIASVLALGALTGPEPVRLGFTLYTWIPAGDFTVEAGFLFDNLTAVMLIVVTWIGALVHVYSIGYMAHDPGKWRFFAYLNLFMFSMLLLILADSYLVIFAAWELVGLSSYLLIGFWYQRRAPALASKKAFLVNRVADQGFLIGILGVFLLTGTRRRPRLLRALRVGRPAGAQRRGLPALRGRGRQVGAVPLPRLAARRHGGPHARLRAHPRGHHGQRRRLLHRAYVAALRHRARRRSSSSPPSASSRPSWRRRSR